jgi:hypothetical protein
MNALSNGIKHYLKIIDSEQRQGWGMATPIPLRAFATKKT